METTKPPTNYFGGKYGTIGQLITDLLPPHRIYIEPFGGMAGVLFLKQPSQVEIYNDIDSRIVNLFRVIRDRKDFAALKRMLKATPFSREEYNHAHFLLRNSKEMDKVQTAWATFIALSFAIQPSMRHNGFRNGGIRFDASVARGYKFRVDALDKTAERLREVIIENTQANKLLMKYNSPEVAIYIDPPYMHSTRSGSKDYSHEMDDTDHEILLTLVKGLKSRVLISAYPHELYEKHLEEWSKIEIDTHSFMAAANNAGNSLRTEVLYMNFKPFR